MTGFDEFEGKVAVVTGAGSGIGRALARRLAELGARVVAADVEAAPLEETGGLIAAAGGTVTTSLTDVSDHDAVEALAAETWSRHGGVHLLCNNAGVFHGGLLWECSRADFEWTLGVNLWGVLHGIAAFVPRMLAASEPGWIVNTASMAGMATTAFSGAYNISKFAAVAASECLAHDLAAVQAPIGVSVLCPGLVDTAIARADRNRPARLASAPTESSTFVAQALAEGTQRGRHPDEIAGLVVAGMARGDFFIGTTPSAPGQLRDRAEDLAAGRLPRSPVFD